MRRRLMILFFGLVVLAFLALGCTDDWDGMDRTGDAWASPAPPPTAVHDWQQTLPGGW